MARANQSGTGTDVRPLERLHQVATDQSLGREAKVEEMLAVGRDRLGTAVGFLTRIEDGIQEILQSVGDNPDLQPGARAPLEQAYCRRTIGQSEPLAVADARAEGWGGDPAYETFGLGCYLGATIIVEDEKFGTVCFADEEPRPESFTERELTFVELLTSWIHYLLEQRAYERELEESRTFVETITNSLANPLYVLDADGTLLRWNDRLEEVTGYEPTDLETMVPTALVEPADRERVEAEIEAAWGGERTAVETTLLTADGDSLPYEFTAAPLSADAMEVTGVVGVGRDISQQKRHEDRLSGILDTTRQLMQARDREQVADIAVSAARDELDFDHCVFRLYDADREELEPAAATSAATALLGERPTYGVDEGYPGEVFATGESRHLDPVTDPSLEPVASVMYYPVGVHGTFSVFATEPGAFDELDRQLLALLSTSAAAACMRAKREREVRAAREHTELVLERVNGLIRNTVEVLVQAATREELEEGVVAELAAAEPHACACIGTPDVTSETLTPSASVGGISLPTDGEGIDLTRAGDPVADAYREGEVQVLADLSSADAGRWGDLARDQPVESLVAVPLSYKEASYGVLVVFAAEADAFDERERVVLEALGRITANAINAIERGRILDATEIIELEFAIDDRDLLFSRLSAETAGTLEVESSEYRADGTLRIYLTVGEADADAFHATAAGEDAVQSVTCIVEHEADTLFELVVDDALLAMLTEYGAVPRSVSATNGDARFTVELPYESEARELFELVEERHPGTDLLGYHERERPVETRQEFRASLNERFTDRQETALRTAFLGGFFDWPRDIDGNELAEAMDISRPTYHQHLRSAQKKVLEELFER